MRLPSATARFAGHPLALVFWILAIWGGMLALRGYWEPDEARFVYVAREMAATGDWLVPHRHGIPYAHKPPLMFWLINLGEAALPLPFGSRLPSFLGVFLALASVYGIAKLWGGKSLALRTVAVLSSSLLFWQTGGMGQIDALLLGLESAALFLLLRNDRLHPTRVPWEAGLLMGLAILAKGPVGLIIPLGTYLSIRAVAPGEGAPRTRFIPLLVVFLLAVIIPVIWIVACWRAGAPETYLRELLFTQNVSRAAGELGHRQPFYYYLLHLPVGFLPWTFFLPAAIARLRKTDPALLRKLIAWAGFVVLFFSIPSSKRNLYVLPAMPALAMMIAAGWEALAASTANRKGAVALVVSAALGATGAALAVLLRNDVAALTRNESTVHALAALSAWPFILLAAAAAASAWSLRKPGPSWPARFAVGLCAVWAACGWFVFPSFDSVKTPVEIIEPAARHIPPDGHILLYAMNGETLALHANRRGRYCVDDDAMRRAMAEQGRGMAIFLAKNAGELTSRFPATTETGSFRMGSKRYVWCAFDAAPSAPEPVRP